MNPIIKDFLTRRATNFALRLFLLQIALTRSRAKYYLKCFSNSEVACSIEVWSKITGGKPVDFESSLYKTIKRVIEYYLFLSFRERQDPTFFERLILRYEFAAAVGTAAKSPAEAKKNFQFILQHRLALILKRYVTIHNFIASLACNEIGRREATLKEGSSASYWSALFEREKLPKQLGRRPQTLLLWRLRRNTARAKRSIAQNNFIKLDFTASELSSLAALSGTLLLLLGYLRIAVLCQYFQIPYERYFTITDYLSSSVSSVQTYLLSAALTIAAWWFLEFATANAYSVQEIEWRLKHRADRLMKLGLHLFVLSCAAAATFLWFEGQIIAAIGPTSIVVMFVSFYFLTYLGRHYFKDPVKFYLYAALIVMCAINGSSGVAREIEAITSAASPHRSRVLEFTDAEYTEPSWRVIAITSGFVILRRQTDGAIHVRNKSDLKSITDSN